MLSLRPIALALPLLAALAASAAAQGLCQIRLDGRIGATDVVEEEGGKKKDGKVRLRTTGHLVEVEIGVVVGNEERDLVLHLQLARGTTGSELAQLIAQRLERMNAPHMLAEPRGDEQALWIDRARYVNLRLGAGLGAAVSCAEGPPAALRILPPSAIEHEAILTAAASTALILRDRPPLRGRAAVDIELAPTMSAPDVATRLSEATAKGWIGDRPGGNSWRPSKMANGATITGFSFQLDSPRGGDWRVELEL